MDRIYPKLLVWLKRPPTAKLVFSICFILFTAIFTASLFYIKIYLIFNSYGWMLALSFVMIILGIMDFKRKNKKFFTALQTFFSHIFLMVSTTVISSHRNR